MMKKFLRTFLSVLLVLTLVVSVTACGKKPPENPGDGDGDTGAVAELNVIAALGLDLFESRQMEAKDKNGALVEATWTSSNTAVATVTTAGFVSAKDLGTTELTATYNGNTAKCTVTVRDSGERPNLWMTSTTKTTIVGGKVMASPVVSYKGSSIDANITVTGGNDEIATSEIKNGQVVFTGVAIGTTTFEIGGTCGNYTLTPIEVTVNIVDNKSMVYSDGDLTLCAIDFGGKLSYHPVSIEIYDNQGALISNPTITWTTSDDTIAQYNATTGRVEAQGKAGEATLRAAYDDVYIEFKVTVVRAEQTITTQLSVSNTYKKVDLAFLSDFVDGDYSQIAIYDKTNGKDVAFTLDADGHTANLTDYSNTVGYYNWVFSSQKFAFQTEIAHASHRVSTVDEYYALGNDWADATKGNTECTIVYESGTKTWLVALAADLDFEGVNVSGKTIFGKQYAEDSNPSNRDYRPATWCGTFDGRGYAIKNAKWDNGMISSLHESGVIKNVALIDCTEEWGGGILGNYGRGTVENCYIKATISGKSSAQAGLYYYSNGAKLLRVKGVIMDITAPAENETYHLITSKAGKAEEPSITDVYAISTTVFKTWSGDTTNGGGVIFPTAAAWNSTVGKLTDSFNGYWTLNENNLMFGDEVVMAW